MAGRLIIKQNDYDGDTKAASIDVKNGTLPADYATFESNVQTLSAAVVALTVGLPAGADIMSSKAAPNSSPSPNPLSQAALQMILEYTHAGNGRTYMIPVAMPDMSLGTAVWGRSGKLTVLLTSSSQWTDLKTAFDAHAVHVNPDGSESDVSLNRVYIRE